MVAAPHVCNPCSANSNNLLDSEYRSFRSLAIGDCQCPIIPCDHHSAMAAVGRILWAAGDMRIPAWLHGQEDQDLLLVLLASFHRVLPPIMSPTRFAASRFVNLRGIVILAETPAGRTLKVSI